MDKVDPIVTKILKAETEYRVQGGKALISVLTPAFISKLPEAAQAHLASHDWNVIYLGNDFTAFITKFFKALEGEYNRVSIIDTEREGARFIKKASFIKDAAANDAKKRQMAEPFLTISDGSAKTNAKFGRLTDSCSNEEIVVDGIKYVGICELMTRFTRMLAPDNRFLRDKGPKIVTRLRVLMQALKEKGQLATADPDPKTYAAPLAIIKSYGHLKGIGENFGDALSVKGSTRSAAASIRSRSKSVRASGKASVLSVKKASSILKSKQSSPMKTAKKTPKKRKVKSAKAASVVATAASRLATAASRMAKAASMT